MGHRFFTYALSNIKKASAQYTSVSNQRFSVLKYIYVGTITNF